MSEFTAGMRPGYIAVIAQRVGRFSMRRSAVRDLYRKAPWLATGGDADALALHGRRSRTSHA